MSNFKGNKKPKVIILMDGYPESAVAAAILQGQGYEVEAVSMVTGCSFNTACASCCVGKTENISKICAHLKLEHTPIDVSELFEAYVNDFSLHEYLNGRLPVPCASCNKHIRYGFLMYYALREKKADFFATGHYAKIINGGQNGAALYTAIDHENDESYLLCGLTRKQLSSLMLPIGDLKKKNVQQMMSRFGLDDVVDTKEGKKTTCLECLFPPGNIQESLKTRAPERFFRAGLLQRLSNDVIQHHNGFYNYSIGQRVDFANQESLHVVSKNNITSVVYLDEEKYLFKSSLVVRDLSFLVPVNLFKKQEYEIKISTSHVPAKGGLYGFEGRRGIVKFRQPQRAIAPGNPVVFYSGPQLIGSGMIESTS